MKCILRSLHLAGVLESQILEILRRGNSLSVAATSLLASPRTVDIYAPPEFDPLVPNSLRSGGFCSQAATQELLISLIVNYLASDASSLVVFEDAFARPSDELVRKTKLEWSGFKNEVYYFLSSRSSAEAIRETLKRAIDPLRFFGLFTRTPRTSGVDVITIQEGDFADFIENATSLVLGIFDGESFLRIPVQENCAQ